VFPNDARGFLGNWWTDQYQMHCVICNCFLEMVEEEQCAAMHLPGACEDHILEVAEEVEKNYPVWPDTYHGHWWLNGQSGS